MLYIPAHKSEARVSQPDNEFRLPALKLRRFLSCRGELFVVVLGRGDFIVVVVPGCGDSMAVVVLGGGDSTVVVVSAGKDSTVVVVSVGRDSVVDVVLG